MGPVVTVMNKRGVNTVKPVLGSPPVLITTIFTSIKRSPCVKESILPAQVANQNTILSIEYSPTSYHVCVMHQLSLNLLPVCVQFPVLKKVKKRQSYKTLLAIFLRIHVIFFHLTNHKLLINYS